MNFSQGYCMIKGKITLMSIQITQKGDLFKREEVCHSVYLGSSIRRREWAGLYKTIKGQ